MTPPRTTTFRARRGGGPALRTAARAAGTVALLAAALTTALLGGGPAAAATTGRPAGACAASSLTAWGSWQGATGSMAGAVDLANVARRTCALRGYATVTLRDRAGRVLHVHVTPVGPRLLAPAVKSPPLVTLAPLQQPGAIVSLQWLNWCGAAPGTISITFTLPGGGGLSVRPVDAVGGFNGVARCDDKQRPSRLLVTPISWPPSWVLHTTAIPVGTTLCGASQLRAQGGRQGGGAVGVAEATVVLTNEGSSPCVLSGIPSVALLAAGGHPLSVSTAAPSHSQSNPVLVAPGASGDLIFYWSNWCGAPPGPLDVAVTPAGSASAVTGPFDGPPNYDYVPTCLDASQASTVMVTDAYVRL